MDLIAKLRYMGRQYSAGQAARGGGQQKHYLEEAADEIETLRAENVELRAQQIEYIGKSAKQQDEIERLNEIMADARCDHCGSSHIRGIKTPNVKVSTLPHAQDAT